MWRAESGFHFVIMDYAAKAVGGMLAAASDALDAVWAGGDSLGEYDLPSELVVVIAKARRATRRRP